MSTSNDPLLQPYQLRHLTLRNRIMTTSHEPAYPEEGMPKARYRAYHVARAKGGVALTMTAGSAAVSRDSPPVFNNILVYKDEVVPWMKDLADACHEHGAAVMIQLTHLGRRTRWDKAFWLPVVSPSHHKEAAHRAFPKKAEEWDIARIIKDYADAAERMQAAGLDGIELQAYGHLMDQFWSPLTNELEAPYGGLSKTGCVSLSTCCPLCAPALERSSSSASATRRTKSWKGASTSRTASRFPGASRRVAWWTSSTSCAVILTPTPA